MNNLIDGKVYWIKHNASIISYGRPDKTELTSSLVRVYHFSKERQTYIVFPMGWDCSYEIKLTDILDAAIVENPFKDANEDA